MTYLDDLKQNHPLTICLTNQVVKNFTANGLLLLGASPAMSEYQADLEDFLPQANGLLVNIGTLNDRSLQLYKDALDIAEKHDIPTVLDPVAAGAGKFRQQVALDLIEHHRISLLRANQLLQLPIVITGETDAIAVNEKVLLLHNGSSLMPLVTGTGCLLGAVLAAFIGLAKEKDLLACLEEALSAYNIAGELAEKKFSEPLPGSFQIAFLDALHQVTNTDIERLKKVEVYHG